MMKSLTDDVNVLKTLSTNSDINALAKEMFGEAITNLVLTNYAKKLSETRAAGKLNIDPNGVLTTHATGIPCLLYTSSAVERSRRSFRSVWVFPRPFRPAATRRHTGRDRRRM